MRMSFPSPHSQSLCLSFLSSPAQIEVPYTAILITHHPAFDLPAYLTHILRTLLCFALQLLYTFALASICSASLYVDFISRPAGASQKGVEFSSGNIDRVFHTSAVLLL
jgi:hypothetical protein